MRGKNTNGATPRSIRLIIFNLCFGNVLENKIKIQIHVFKFNLTFSRGAWNAPAEKFWRDHFVISAFRCEYAAIVAARSSADVKLGIRKQSCKDSETESSILRFISSVEACIFFVGQFLSWIATFKIVFYDNCINFFY